MFKRIILILIFLYFSSGVSLPAPGDFDTTFSGDGTVLYDSGIDDSGMEVAVQPDGKIVAVGTSYSPHSVIVMRYNSDGSMDSSFGVAGIFSYSPGIASGEGVALQSDGKIVVAGSRAGANMDGLLLRLNSNGSLDTTFGTNGVVTYDGPPDVYNSDSLTSVAIQSDGKIVAAGQIWNGSVNYGDVVVLRYNSDGTLDNTFSGDGVLTYNGIGSNNDWAYGIVLQLDGKVVVVGEGYNGTNFDVIILRYNINGTPDNSFGVNGVVTYHNAAGYAAGCAVTIQSDGKIVAVGVGGNNDMLVLRYNSDGTLDTTFGTNGVSTYPPGSTNYGTGLGVVIQPDRKIVVVGESDNDAVILRYNSNGTLDNTFGTNGVVPYNNLSGYDAFRDVAIQSDGKIVVTGISFGTNYDLITLRLIGHEPDVSIDPTSFNFGNVIVGGSSAQTFIVSNAGDLDLEIYTISLTGTDYTEFSIQNDNCSGQTLTPLAYCTVQILFSPTLAGPKSANLSIPTNDPDTPALDVPLSGTGIIYTQVLLLSPNGGEVLPPGSTYNIQWGAPAKAVKFKLKYSLDNGLTWFPIPKTADFITGTNYDWTVPKPLGNQKKCLVKVIGYKANGVLVGLDRSDPFTIEVVRVTAPGEGETLIAADIYPIHWLTNATKKPVTKVKLYYTKDGGSTWNSIFTFRDSNPGSYDWQVPCVKNDKTSCKVKVILLDADGNIVGEDVSNGYFTIARTCNDISGNWNGTDKITVTCCAQGQCESGTSIGSASIFVNQNDCKINWTIPGTNVKRSGITWCNNLQVSGIFCNPEALPGAIFSTNQITASGTVNGDTINLIGWGQCSGTYQGVTFECNGRDKTVLTRTFFGITEEKQTAKEPKLFMNNSLRIFGAISP